MPLPHRPMTTPGAQSTLNFTRVPLESRSAQGGSSSASAIHTATLSERMPVDGNTVSSLRATASTAVEEPADSRGSRDGSSFERTSVAAEQTPSQELVPDVSLDEYVHNFHYEPPSEPTEVTMRGDTTVTEQRVSAEKAPPTDVAGRVEAVATTALGEEKPLAPSGEESDTVSRLGLDPELPAEVTERPRFLDLGEVPEPARSSSPSSGTSTIVGPSFLGLSDPPQIADSIEAEEAPRRSHWRAWLAVAVVLVFGGLGLLEWRAQSHQTENGPVEVMKTKIRSWTKGTPAPSSQAAPASSSSDNNSKPEMQVQEQPKPQQPSPPATAPQKLTASSNAATTTIPASGSAQQNAATASGSAAPPKTSAESTTPASQKPAATEAAASGAKSTTTGAAKPQTTAQAATPKPKAARPADTGDDNAAPAKGGVGADELNKAKNASDSAAEAAWLWKSTAKGNPDAPVLLADMYMKGDGVPRSCEQAVVLLKTAAEKENARARNRLASMYATGNCVQRNRVEAYRWLSSALVANPHSEWAQQNKDLIWQQMTPDERVMAEKYR